MMTDPIADMFTRIRNGAQARRASVEVPWSGPKEAIARVLVEEGFLGQLEVLEQKPRRLMRLELRYDGRRRSVISGLKRISRPSLRVYVGAKEIPPIRGGLGINILSTPKGLLVDREARRQNVGGEIVCTVW